MNRHDQECLQAVFSDGLAEMARGQLAGQQAQAAAVIAYARRMVVDHARSSEEARQIATHLGVSLAQTADATQQQGMADLERVSGGNFDRHYLRHEIEAHEKALARAQQCADGAAGAQIRAFAGQVASLLSDHLDLAKQAELTLPRKGAAVRVLTGYGLHLHRTGKRRKGAWNERLFVENGIRRPAGPGRERAIEEKAVTRQ